MYIYKKRMDVSLFNMIYLDNSATTKPCPQAIEAMLDAMTSRWGNPSSLYRIGLEAEQLLSAARASAARWLSCREDEIYFTAGGTEANNLALFGAAEARKRRGRRIVTTAIEHPSVMEVMRLLEKKGFEVIYLPPQENGCVAEEAIRTAVTPDTILVSMMLVNNETGAIQPVAAAKEAILAAGAPALLHCDAVQAFGKMPISVTKLGVDLLSASGHKIHAGKGAGFLYKARAVHLPPLILGGGQEKGLRSGTESVPMIAAFGAAIDALPALEAQLPRMRALNDYARKVLLATGLVRIHSPGDALPYVLSISVPGYRSETLLHFLEARDIYVSSGSACAKGKGSYVLRAMGLSDDEADSALRLSFSRETTKEEIDLLAEALTEAAARLRRK